MIDIDTIIRIESSGDSSRISPKGAVGLMGVIPDALKDWNERYPEQKYTMEQLKDSDINIRVGSWYMNVRIPELLAEYGIAPSIEAMLSAYNMGAKAFSEFIDGKREMPEETSDYMIKYRMGGDVASGQKRLKELGYDPGPIDGIFGDKTREAFNRFNEAEMSAPILTEQFGIGSLKQ